MEETIIPIIGNFDQIKLEEKAIDFIIEFDSLHHSFDLAKTISESARILKPRGQHLAIDRSHWSSSKTRRADLVNTGYSRRFRTDRGLDENISVTRAENGEYEYLLSDYMKAFHYAGFYNTDWVILFVPKLSVIKQRLISAVPSRLGKNTKNLSSNLTPEKITNFYNYDACFSSTKFVHFVNFPRDKDSS